MLVGSELVIDCRHSPVPDTQEVELRGAEDGPRKGNYDLKYKYGVEISTMSPLALERKVALVKSRVKMLFTPILEQCVGGSARLYVRSSPTNLKPQTPPIFQFWP
jgi:hypothetical protein